MKPPAITDPSNSPTCSLVNGRHARAIPMDGRTVAAMHQKRPLKRFDLCSCGNTSRAMMNSLANVKEHATLSARARVDHGVDVEVTKGHVNRAADRGCCVSTCSHLRFLVTLMRLHHRPSYQQAVTASCCCGDECTYLLIIRLNEFGKILFG